MNGNLFFLQERGNVEGPIGRNSSSAMMEDQSHIMALSRCAFKLTTAYRAIIISIFQNDPEIFFSSKLFKNVPRNKE